MPSEAKPGAWQTEYVTPEPDLWTLRLGVVPYERALGVQRDLCAARQDDAIPDTLVILEHTPVFTKGRRSEARELGMGEDWYRAQGIDVCETDRGGRVTYHGPGQIVAYPIVDLAGLGADGRPDVHAFVRSLEEAMISTLSDHGVPAQVFSGLTGVWTAGPPPVAEGETGPQGTEVVSSSPELAVGARDARKIGSIGIHVSRGVTTHGLAINVNNDLQPFEWIVPCGIDAVRMASVGSELGAEQDLDEFAGTLVERTGEALGRAPRAIGPDDLAGCLELPGELLQGASTGALR